MSLNRDGNHDPEKWTQERHVEECIVACSACAAASEECAVVCLREPPTKELGHLILLARTCADVCLLTSRLLAQKSEFVQEYCALCAEVCHTLHEECLKHSMLKCCRRCAEVAHRCDRACQKAAV